MWGHFFDVASTSGLDSVSFIISKLLDLFLPSLVESWQIYPTLVKQLQEQVDVITKYLAKEKLAAPTFIPSGNNPLKTTVGSLPPAAEEARTKLMD